MKNETLSSGMAVQCSREQGSRAVQLRGAECLKNGRAEMFWLRDKLNVISQSPQLQSMAWQCHPPSIRCCGVALLLYFWIERGCLYYWVKSCLSCLGRVHHQMRNRRWIMDDSLASKRSNNNNCRPDKKNWMDCWVLYTWAMVSTRCRCCMAMVCRGTAKGFITIGIN